MAHLTTAQRRALPAACFALPASRALPLCNARGELDYGHVTAASARLSMMRNRRSISPAEYKTAHRRIARARNVLGAYRSEKFGKSREEETMSRAMTVYDNPDSLGFGLAAAGIFAAGGAIIGGVTETPLIDGILDGATAGLSITALGGTIVGFVSPSRREPGLMTGGLSLIGLLGIGLINRIRAGMAAPSTTAPTT